MKNKSVALLGIVILNTLCSVAQTIRSGSIIDWISYQNIELQFDYSKAIQNKTDFLDIAESIPNWEESQKQFLNTFANATNREAADIKMITPNNRADITSDMVFVIRFLIIDNDADFKANGFLYNKSDMDYPLTVINEIEGTGGKWNSFVNLFTESLEYAGREFGQMIYGQLKSKVIGDLSVLKGLDKISISFDYEHSKINEVFPNLLKSTVDNDETFQSTIERQFISAANAKLSKFTLSKDYESTLAFVFQLNIVDDDGDCSAFVKLIDKSQNDKIIARIKISGDAKGKTDSSRISNVFSVMGSEFGEILLPLI